MAKLIEDLLNYAEKELYLTAEGRAYARNRLLELLQVEPCNVRGDYPADMQELLERITSYAVASGIVEEENAVKFPDKLIDVVMPSQGEAVRLAQGVHRNDETADSLSFFRDLMKNSRYISPRPSIGWSVGNDIVLIPEEDRREDTGAYPLCSHCIENVGFCGLQGERSQYTRRVLPVELDGEKWYFSFEREPFFPDEFCVACGTHRSSGDGRILPRMMDFIERFPSVFCCTFPEQTEHDRFYGGKKVLPLLQRPVEKKLKEKDGIGIYVTKWDFPALRICGKDKKSVTKIAQSLAKVLRTFEGTPIYIAVSYNDGFVVDLVQAQTPSSVFAPTIGYFPFGLFVLPASTQEDVYRLIQEFTQEKMDFEKIHNDSSLSKYLETVIRLAASYGSHLSSEKAREILLFTIGDACGEEGKKNKKELDYFKKILSEVD